MERFSFTRLFAQFLSALLAGTMLLVPAAQSAEDFKPFRPHIIDGGDDPVCQVALKYYQRVFDSPNGAMGNEIEGPGVSYPPLEEFSAKYGSYQLQSIRYGSISLEGKERYLIYYDRPLYGNGYRFHTGFLTSADQFADLKKILEDNLKSGTPRGVEDLENRSGVSIIYPVRPPQRRPWKSTEQSYPFLYNGKLYIVVETVQRGTTFKNRSKNIFRVSPDGEASNVCLIELMQPFEDTNAKNELSFFSAYHKTVREMTRVKDSICIQSHTSPDQRAAKRGKLLTAMMVSRPWALNKRWEAMGRTEGGFREGFQKKHFSDWKYQDVWSYREAGVLDSARRDAKRELTRYYKKYFDMSDEEAAQLADDAVEGLPGGYYSLGVYYEQNKDFDALKGLIDGTFSDWSALGDLLTLKRQKKIPEYLLLMVDVPQQIGNLPDALKADTIINYFDKDLLMYAAHMNNYDAVKYLLAIDWPLERVTRFEQYRRGNFVGGCHYINRTNRSALTYAAENASIELIKLLVEAGMDTEIHDSQGNSLDYYINLNPRFSAEDKALGFNGLLAKYAEAEPVTPSFACGGKLSRLESAICSKPGLAIYDRELSRAYGKLRGRDDIGAQMKKSQVDWIGWRTRECRRYKEDFQLNACIARTTRARIRYLDYVSEAFDSM
ncbi:lysozyme inhibitor LprI family protein [Emcibacter nanhaiensis]|uniref:DUF1311 domain-containing protein n=1 Tax=Emcibacter nanhaiensis TaxID=1505037 RepID=A0A501PME6_9PROT|nr:lysozyme inhibitor LprI family protein [Emcibacter nanhaiensis]TPD61603.1 DUF1311 domain-containing protein [Emcibacter nanhaiensis]